MMPAAPEAHWHYPPGNLEGEGQAKDMGGGSSTRESDPGIQSREVNMQLFSP
jgi:hypothetical protein